VFPLRFHPQTRQCLHYQNLLLSWIAAATWSTGCVPSVGGEGLETELLPTAVPAPDAWRVEAECMLFYQGCGCGCGIASGGDDVFGVKLVWSQGRWRWVKR
jgi:hypothetical protein